MAQYNPSNSRIREDAMEKWLETPIKENPGCVPYIGERTEKRLAKHGIATTWQLLAKFLSHLCENEISADSLNYFKQVLVDAQTPTQFSDSVVTAVSERIFHGFTCPMVCDEHRVKNSQLTAADMEEFLKKDMTGDIKKDIKGIGQETKTLLQNEGIYTTWQFFAKALQFGRDADSFDQYLKEKQVVSNAWRATVIHQVVEKMHAGLRIPGMKEIQSAYDEPPPSPVKYPSSPSHDSTTASKPQDGAAVTTDLAPATTNTQLLCVILLVVFAVFLASIFLSTGPDPRNDVL